MLTKCIYQTEIKVDTGKRLITAYASKRTRDLGGDLIPSGAFTKTLLERKDRIVALRDHDPKRICGRPVAIDEDGEGLLTETKVAKTPLGDETLELASDGVLSGVSIGYDTVSGKVAFETVDGKNTRVLREVKLYEYSFVPFPMHEDARIIGVKSLWGLSEAIRCIQTVRDLVRDSYAQLTPEEIDIVTRLVAEMSAAGPEMKALLQPALPTEESRHPSTDPEAKALQSLVDQLATLNRK